MWLAPSLRIHLGIGETVDGKMADGFQKCLLIDHI